MPKIIKQNWNSRLTYVDHLKLRKNLVLLMYKVEKAMAPHSSTLAWKIPWTEEPGRLKTMVSLRVGHD